jgi:hypothetical protein
MALHSVGSSQCHVYRLYALKGPWLSTDERAMDTDQYTLYSKYKTDRMQSTWRDVNLYIDKIYCLVCSIFTPSIFSKFGGNVWNSSYKGAYQSTFFTSADSLHLFSHHQVKEEHFCPKRALCNNWHSRRRQDISQKTLLCIVIRNIRP